MRSEQLFRTGAFELTVGLVDKEAHEQLVRHRRIWEQKPVLGKIYREEFFSRFVKHYKPGGISLEVGGGPAYLREMIPDLISTDLVLCPWLDTVADAHHLPFKSNSVTNIMGLDILHHLEAPMTFLKEAQRVLVDGGRLMLVEPWVSPFSYLIYRYMHQEDCDLSAKPFAEKIPGSTQQKKAFEGNQAIPYLLFGPKNLQSTLASVPSLKPALIERFCLFAYLLSFGFKPVNLLPESLYPWVSKFEQATLPLWRSLAALRVFLVFEKQGN